MILQAEIYNQSLERLASMLEDWRLDADKYLVKIDTAAKQNKPTASMETYHYRQLEKISIVEAFAQSASALLKELSRELQNTKERSQLQTYSALPSTERTRICDLPASPAEYHFEQIELLTEIREDLKKILSQQETNDNGSQGKRD